MEACVHPLTQPDDEARYCRVQLCLECRRWKAMDERDVLMLLLSRARQNYQDPLLVFQTLTLQDACPHEVKDRADLLVTAFKRLRRRLPYHVGWCRVIEISTATMNPEQENAHLHFVILFPRGQYDKVMGVDWNELWKTSAGVFARDTDPAWGVAAEPEAVIAYMTKGQPWDFLDDGLVGLSDPRRYVERVKNGHAKFSGGGALRLRVFSESDKQVGFDVVIPRSSERHRVRHPERLRWPDIPVENTDS